MADNPEVIRQQMEETRASLTEKLETLENQVVETVQGATTAVAETVENVKEAVQDTVQTVTGSVQDTVETVKSTFDVPLQVERHPWTMLGLAVATGFVGGYILDRRERSRSLSFPDSHGEAMSRRAYLAQQTNGAASQQPPAPPRPSLFSTLTDKFGPELDKLKGLAIGMGLSMVRDAVTNSAPPETREKLNEVMDGIISKLGGQPQPASPPSPAHEERAYEQRYPETGKTLTAARYSG